MARRQPCAKYEYVITPSGPKILPVDEPSCKDEENPADYNAGGYLPIKVGDTFKHSRYRVIRKLGWGHFSTVWLVKDRHTHSHSALKVVKSAGRYAETARDEIKLLTHVSSFSPTHPGRQHVVSFFDSFSHQGPEAPHVCIVFEPLGENLLALIDRNKKNGVPKSLVKVIAKQVLLGLQYLHDECDLVHTDIKPENILISIPDIEAHIRNELAQSKSPTSRRVGIPLPTRSRAGVTIPYGSQRARRQVQIFDSQPLSSPGRSVEWRSTGQVVTSMRQLGSGSGGNSLGAGYVAQMHISRLAGSSSTSNFHSLHNGTVANHSSSAPKVSSGLSSFSTCAEDLRKPEEKSSKVDAPVPPPAAPIQSDATSPSTSSSSSSISSTMASNPIGSGSVTSTPPTSLSNSIGNVVAGFMGLAKVATEVNARLIGSNKLREEDKASESERVGVPVFGTKGKERATLESESQSAVSSSWKIPLAFSASWDKVSSSLSSFRSGASADNTQQLTARPDKNDKRSSSGISASNHWKDPGTAAPAPAVVVSAVVSADGQEGVGGQRSDFFPLPTVNLPQAKVHEPSTTESHSVSAAVAHLSLGGTSVLLESKNKTPDISHHPSLLTQTAPACPPPGPKRALLRASPPLHGSQLSAHMHAHQPTSLNQCSGLSPLPPKRTTKSRTTARVLHPHPPPTSVSTASTSVTPTPAITDPSPPPPTPVTSPTSCHFAPAYINDLDRSDSEDLQPKLVVPPISVKIADLGNATPSTKHFTEDIQTRQYRAPEAILGRRDWDARADIWSVACVVFELLTAEYLFDPQGQGELFTKDDDHMAQIIELLGDFPVEVKMGGKFSRELFDHAGALRYIRTLKPWPLRRVMTEKYSYSEADSAALCSFLEPMLAVDMRERKGAREMSDHPWLIPSEADGIVTSW